MMAKRKKKRSGFTVNRNTIIRTTTPQSSPLYEDSTGKLVIAFCVGGVAGWFIKGWWDNFKKPGTGTTGGGGGGGLIVNDGCKVILEKINLYPSVGQAKSVGQVKRASQDIDILC